MINEELLDEFLDKKCPLAGKFDTHGLLKTQLSMFYEFLDEKGMVANKLSIHNISQWVAVSERLPEVSQEVLCWCKDYSNIPFIAYYDGCNWRDTEFESDLNIVEGTTHWIEFKPPTG